MRAYGFAARQPEDGISKGKPGSRETTKQGFGHSDPWFSGFPLKNPHPEFPAFFAFPRFRDPPCRFSSFLILPSYFRRT